MPLKRGRDLKAFEGLVRPYLDDLYGMALHLTGNRDEAEDLVQETCVRAYQSFHRLKAEGAIKAWLFKILAHAFYDRLRKKSPEVPLEAEGGGPAGGIPESCLTYPGPEQELLQKELETIVREAIDHLPPDFRMVVLLADIEGFSYKEIARILNIPIGTVMSRLNRGRAILRRKLQWYAEEQGFVHRAKSEGGGEEILDLRGYGGPQEIGVRV